MHSLGVKAPKLLTHFKSKNQRTLILCYITISYKQISKINASLLNPNYIFFDEATNALDANNERAIVENLNEFYKGKTVVIVAHRLSTVKNADNIVVLEHGKIVEQGTHAELTALKGRYYELVRNQLELGN